MTPSSTRVFARAYADALVDAREVLRNMSTVSWSVFSPTRRRLMARDEARAIRDSARAHAGRSVDDETRATPADARERERLDTAFSCPTLV